MDFKAFPKIARISKAFFVTITEKIDGSNAQIVIDAEGNIRVGSRNRWITPGKETDNYGFAGWVSSNEDELRKLGPGQHFGEWYGSGIQCGYGLTGGEKRFALFDARRWTSRYKALKEGHDVQFPDCVEVVPVLYQGAFNDNVVDACMERLRIDGSVHVPGFKNPEGIIVEMNGELAKHTFQHINGKWAA